MIFEELPSFTTWEIKGVCSPVPDTQAFLKRGYILDHSEVVTTKLAHCVTVTRYYLRGAGGEEANKIG